MQHPPFLIVLFLDHMSDFWCFNLNSQRNEKRQTFLPRDLEFFEILGNDTMIIADSFVGCEDKKYNGLHTNHLLIFIQVHSLKSANFL